MSSRVTSGAFELQTQAKVPEKRAAEPFET